MLCLMKIGEEKMISEGWHQIAYRKDNIEILLSTIQPGTPFAEHAHEHIQFGFCFSGEFTFIADTEKYLLKQGGAYILNSNVKHKADADIEFYALDFKMVLPQFMKQKIGLFSELGESCTRMDYDFKEYTVTCINNEKSISCEMTVNFQKQTPILIVSQRTSVKVDGEICTLEPMSIYKAAKYVEQLEIIDRGKMVVITEK